MLGVCWPSASWGRSQLNSRAKRAKACCCAVRFAAGGLEKAVKARPAAFFHKSNARLVSIGNTDVPSSRALNQKVSSGRFAYQIRKIGCPRLRWIGTGPALKTANVSWPR